MTHTPPRLIYHKSKDYTDAVDGRSLAELKDWIDGAIAKHGSDATVDISGSDYGATLKVEWTIEETDAQYESRLRDEQRQALAQEHHERELLARLKAKYGG